jgi:hypothetical protein
MRPRSAGWGRGAAAAFERMRHLETMNPVPDPEPDANARRGARRQDNKD